MPSRWIGIAAMVVAHLGCDSGGGGGDFAGDDSASTPVPFGTRNVYTGIAPDPGALIPMVDPDLARCGLMTNWGDQWRSRFMFDERGRRTLQESLDATGTVDFAVTHAWDDDDCLNWQTVWRSDGSNPAVAVRCDAFGNPLVEELFADIADPEPWAAVSHEYEYDSNNHVIAYRTIDFYLPAVVGTYVWDGDFIVSQYQQYESASSGSLGDRGIRLVRDDGRLSQAIVQKCSSEGVCIDSHRDEYAFAEEGKLQIWREVDYEVTLSDEGTLSQTVVYDGIWQATWGDEHRKPARIDLVGGETGGEVSVTLELDCE